ncbi:MAG: ABC transporter ATP-binding protein [bacterium]
MSSWQIIIHLKKLCGHLQKEKRAEVLLLIVAMVLTSVVEIFAIGSIFPFLTALTAPDIFLNRYRLVAESIRLQELSPNQATLFCTVIFVAVVFVANIARLWLFYYSNNTGFKLGVSFNRALFSAMLRIPYEDQIKIPISETIANATAKSGIIIYNIILPCVNIVAVSILILFAISGFVLFVPYLALSVLATLIVLYIITNQLTKKKLQSISAIINNNTAKVIREIQEAFGVIREVTLYSLSEKYEEQYSKADQKLRLAQSRAAFFAAAPRYILEAMAVIFLAIFAYISQTNNSEFLPLIGFIAFAVQRLLPQLQQAYSSFSSVQGAQHVLFDINNILDASKAIPAQANVEIKLDRRITLSSVAYKIPETNIFPLRNISATFDKGQITAIVGASGVGKSTLLDIICGLYPPSLGEIYIDQEKLTAENVHVWRKNVAYVSQAPFLFEGSILRNIAQTIDGELIDENRAYQAARYAQIYDWVISLPNSFHSIIRDRGSNLSGGQKQRICIARALYRRAEVLCLDESSNALDDRTERELYATLELLKRNIAVIVVTHKSSALMLFDMVYEIKEGSIRVYDNQILHS